MIKSSKIIKLTKEQFCTALTLGYHLAFIGGAFLGIGNYIDRIEKLEKLPLLK
jgi:hypothetical protein